MIQVAIRFEYDDDYKTKFIPIKKYFNLIEVNTKKDNGWAMDAYLEWKLISLRPTVLQQYF